MRVTAVASGREMNERLGDSGVDLILLDLRLRGDDGLQIACQLRDRWAGP